MNRQHCHCSPAYGAMMHALPRDASQLKGMSEQDIFTKAMPWVNRVPPVSEFEFDTWTVKAVNPNPKGLGDLGDLAELSGLKKKLKKVAKKLAAPIKKVVKAQVKIVKKAAKSKIIKKIARPLAYAVGAATGTVALVAKADKIRTAARKVRAKVKSFLPTEQAQAEQPQPEPAQEQATYNEPAQESYSEPSYQPAPLQNSFAAPQTQVQAQQQSWQQAQQQYQPQNSFVESRQPQSSPFSLQPMYSNPVQRLSQEETEEQPQIVGLSAAGIMENIKANPLPWGAGLAVAVYLITRRPAHQNQRAY
jgi:hypothetical protein